MIETSAHKENVLLYEFNAPRWRLPFRARKM